VKGTGVGANSFFLPFESLLKPSGSPDVISAINDHFSVHRLGSWPHNVAKSCVAMAPTGCNAISLLRTEN